MKYIELDKKNPNIYSMGLRTPKVNHVSYVCNKVNCGPK